MRPIKLGIYNNEIIREIATILESSSIAIIKLFIQVSVIFLLLIYCTACSLYLG